MAAVTYLHYNPNTFDIALFKLTVTLNPVIYGILIVILIWASINVTNCSDGVDGLCGTLSAITLTSAFLLFRIFDIESSFRHVILIMVVCILGYLWFNASPSRLLMGDARFKGYRNIYCIFIPQAPLPTVIHSTCHHPYNRWRTWINQGFFHKISSYQSYAEYTNTIFTTIWEKQGWSVPVVFRFAIIQIVVAAAINICGYVMLFAGS